MPLGGRRKPQGASLLAVNPAARAARELKLIRLESSIGSVESNDLVIRDGSVSRRHALIQQNGRKWQVIDNGSTNGTYVGDRKAVDWIELRDGAEVRFGGARFIFRSSGASGARATRDLKVKPRASGLRALTVLIAAALVISFGGTQYYFYRWYEAKMGHTQSSPSAQPSPKLVAMAESSNHPPAARESSAWLERVNHWRTLAGLRAIVSDPELNAAAKDHARYLVKHALEGKADELDGGGAHTEDPSDRWYTREGLAAAQNSDVDPPCRGCMLTSASEHVDGLVAVPFHRVRILDPAVTKGGYGSYTENGLQGAVLYMPVPPEDAATFAHPVEFPPDGSSLGFAAYQSGEWPDPLTSCPDYNAPTGLPITLQLGRRLVADVSDYSLREGTQTLESCVFNASTYNNPDEDTQSLARDILKGWGTAVLIPRQPLASGQTYTVSITANGETYNWSFSVE